MSSHDMQHSFTIKCVYNLNIMMHVSIYLLKTNVSILIVFPSTNLLGES